MFEKGVSAITSENANDGAILNSGVLLFTTVFVYGTLMRRENNHKLLAESSFLGEARTEEGFTLHDLGGCPGMTRGGSGRVYGEVYEMTPEILHALDELEGHPDWYQRTLIALDDGRRVETYLLSSVQVRGAELIPGGDWRKRADNFLV
jgi:gamma-glutamylaminecyclotransferase